MTTLFDLDRVLLFTLLVARASGLVAAAPFFGETFVPARVKALVTGALAVVMMGFAPAPPEIPTALLGLVLMVLQELTVGLAIGFTARLLFTAFEMAGHVIAVQMGFGMAQVFDPMQGHRGNLMARWMWLVAMTIFLGLNGHHLLLRAMAGTMDLVPPGHGLLGAGVVELMVDYVAISLGTALQIGAPAIGIGLLTTVGLGILARTVPQMNVFIVGFPIKITMGLVAVALSLPYLLEVARREVGALVDRLSALMLAA